MLNSDEERLRFLLFVQQEVPKLFSDAAKYDINLLELLQSNEDLLSALDKIPAYAERFSERRSLLTLNIAPQGGQNTVVMSSTNQALLLEEWKMSLNRVFAKYTDPSKVQEILLERSKYPSQKDSVLGAVMSLLMQDRSPELESVKTQLRSEDFKKLNIEEKISFLQKKLPQQFLNSISSNFDPKRAGFSEGTIINSISDLLAIPLRMQSLDEDVAPLLQLQAMKKSSNPTEEQISKLNWDDFSKYHDCPVPRTWTGFRGVKSHLNGPG